MNIFKRIKMMTTIMEDTYDELDRISFPTSNALMFERVEEKKDIVKFAMLYYKSNVSKEFFHNPTIFSQSPLYVLQLFKEELQEKGMDYEKDIPSPQIIDTDAAYWLGFTIAYWHIVKNYDFSLLPEQDCQWLFDNYDSLHTQSCEYVYDLYISEQKGISESIEK